MSAFILLNRYYTKDNNITFDLRFKNRLTLINGESGIGKTMLFKAIKRNTLLDNNKNIICLNYKDKLSGNIEYILNSVNNKVIIIDDADISLTFSQRMQISLDTGNQYIIFTHSTDGYKPSRGSLAELIIKEGKGRLHYLL